MHIIVLCWLHSTMSSIRYSELRDALQKGERGSIPKTHAQHLLQITSTWSMQLRATHTTNKQTNNAVELAEKVLVTMCVFRGQIWSDSATAQHQLTKYLITWFVSNLSFLQTPVVRRPQSTTGDSMARNTGFSCVENHR